MGKGKRQGWGSKGSGQLGKKKSRDREGWKGKWNKGNFGTDREGKFKGKQIIDKGLQIKK